MDSGDGKEKGCLKIIKFDNMRIKYDIFIKKCDNIYHNEWLIKKYDNHKGKIIKKPDNIRINTIGGNVINQNVESSR